MKNLFRALIVLAIVILAGIAALSFWVGPKVEEMTRRDLARLPEAAAAEYLRFSAPEVREIEFSPFSRRLTLRGLEIRGTMDPQVMGSGNPMRHSAPGEVRYTLEEVSYRVPLRALLLYTPLRGLVLPETGMMTIGEDLRLSNFASFLTQGPMRSQSTAKSQEAEGIRMDSALLRQLLEERESQGDTPRKQPAPDLLGIFYGMGIKELRVSDMRMNIAIPEGDVNVDFSCESMRMRNWEGRRLQEAALDGLNLKVDGREFLRLGNLTEKGITFPEKAALRELMAQAYRPNPDQRALQALLLRMFTGGEPLIRELSAADLRVALDGKAGQAVTLGKAALHWQSNAPLQYSFSVDALSVPTALVERESGLTFPGLPALVLDATLGFAAQGAEAMREQGTIRAAGLGALEYDFVIAGKAGALSSRQALLGSTFGNVRLKYTDQRLAAYLARTVLPSPEMATPIFKAAVARFCSGPAPENTAIREALDSFATLPGVLEVQSKPGKAFNLLEAVGQLAAGNPGALFSVTAQPGKESLEAQITGLNEAAASPAK